MSERVVGAVVAVSLDDPAAVAAIARLLTDYHLQTESEKGAPVAGVAALPERYRREIESPAECFAEATVLLALPPGAAPAVRDAVGCVILSRTARGTDGGEEYAEVKRLWVDPGQRGRGTARALLEAAIGAAAAMGPAVSGVRLSVWSWRAPALALYDRLGFVVVPEARAWESRAELVCLERRVP